MERGRRRGQRRRGRRLAEIARSAYRSAGGSPRSVPQRSHRPQVSGSAWPARRHVRLFRAPRTTSTAARASSRSTPRSLPEPDVTADSRDEGRPCVPLARVCQDCGNSTTSPVLGRCPCCAAAHARREAARRAAKPQRQVWNSSRWQRRRRAQMRADDWTCRLCGHRDVDNRGRTLVVDHYPYSVAELQAAGLDPVDDAELRTLCLSCSGSADGGRARA